MQKFIYWVLNVVLCFARVLNVITVLIIIDTWTSSGQFGFSHNWVFKGFTLLQLHLTEPKVLTQSKKNIVIMLMNVQEKGKKTWTI